MTAVPPGGARDGEGGAELGFERRPIVFGVGRVQCRLERALGRRIAVQRKAGAVGAAFAHLRQHSG